MASSLRARVSRHKCTVGEHFSGDLSGVQTVDGDGEHHLPGLEHGGDLANVREGIEVLHFHVGQLARGVRESILGSDVNSAELTIQRAFLVQAVHRIPARFKDVVVDVKFLENRSNTAVRGGLGRAHKGFFLAVEVFFAMRAIEMRHAHFERSLRSGVLQRARVARDVHVPLHTLEFTPQDVRRPTSRRQVAEVFLQKRSLVIERGVQFGLQVRLVKRRARKLDASRFHANLGGVLQDARHTREKVRGATRLQHQLGGKDEER